jgi:hypothetical protein
MNKTIIAGIAVAIAAGAACIATAETKAETRMQYVTLNNGEKLPQLGFGTWTLKGEVAWRA